MRRGLDSFPFLENGVPLALRKALVRIAAGLLGRCFGDFAFFNSARATSSVSQLKFTVVFFHLPKKKSKCTLIVSLCKKCVYKKKIILICLSPNGFNVV